MRVMGYDDAPHGHAEMIFDNVKVPLGNTPSYPLTLTLTLSRYTTSRPLSLSA